MVTILYFARLKEALGRASEELALPRDVSNLAALRAVLVGRGGAWAQELAEARPVRAAVNQDMAASDTPV
jgi:molybdopterin synthase sulfur carrier subunit